MADAWVHTTGYRYKSPAAASYNEARLTPRSDSRQNVIVNRVETTPATRSYRYVDYWRTAVTAFDLHAPHLELEVTSLRGRNRKGRIPSCQCGNWDDLESEAIADRYDEVLAPTPCTPSSKRIDRVGRHLAKGREPHEAVLGAVDWVRDQLQYVPGTTGVHPRAWTHLAEGKGVCQDFAHLSLILLRSMGIPARYVSGYLHPKANARIGEVVQGRVMPGSRHGPAVGGIMTPPTTPRSMSNTSVWAAGAATRT